MRTTGRSLALVALFAAGCQAGRQPDWRAKLAERLPLLGHRNYVVIADSAYPLQVSPGLETVVAGGGHLDAVDYVLKQLASSGHVRPIVWLDRELAHVPEKNAKGVTALRAALTKRLEGLDVRTAPHDDIIKRLDETARTFRVLLLKTPLEIPYTSVFIELQCGYWSDDAERELRRTIGHE